MSSALDRLQERLDFANAEPGSDGVFVDDKNDLALALTVIEAARPLVRRYCEGMATGDWKALGNAYNALTESTHDK